MGDERQTSKPTLDASRFVARRTTGRPRTCLILVACYAVVGGCVPAERGEKTPDQPHAQIEPTPIDLAAIEPQVEAFCGDCHATPPPDSFPREAWPLEVERGFNFYFESFRKDLDPPDPDDVIAYFQALAPEELVVVPPQPDKGVTPDERRFAKAHSTVPQLELPAVATIQWLQLPGEQQPELVFCDMRSGQVRRLSFQGREVRAEPLTTLKNPARLAICDLDNDGLNEVIAAELGSFTSGDHQRGAIVWLRQDHEAEGEGWLHHLLVSGLGRVADVRPADFDQDGDIDLAVAEFGHVRTGRILLLENVGIQDGIPQFREHVLDDRHGGIHVPIADLNGDGKMDIVALISQEHELIEAYLNQGGNEFRRQRIFASGDPAYGSSGIELVDIDGDNDLDVLYSNGDTFGSDYLKPYHGITWLENRGSLPFEPHRLADMVGVQRAIAADLDNDGDQDVVAVAFMPSHLVDSMLVKQHASVLWLEQVGPGRFERRTLETGALRHVAVEAGDWDLDGDTDLAVGNFQDVVGDRLPWLTVWWNEAREPIATSSEGSSPTSASIGSGGAE